jgi:hypothetical protein
MAIHAQAQDADVDRAILTQPLSDPLAFAVWFRGIALERSVAIFQIQWIDQARAQMLFASRRVMHLEPAPLIQFKHTHSAEEIGPYRVILD